MGGKGAFFGFGSTSIRSTIVTGQTEGLKVGCGGMGGLQKLITFFSGWAGLQKLITVLDTRNGHGSIGFFSSLTIQRFFLFFHDII